MREAAAAAAVPGAAYLAAGTNLLDLIKGGVTQPKRLVDITHLPGLNRVEDLPEGRVRIGALVRNADLAHDRNFSRHFPPAPMPPFSPPPLPLPPPPIVHGHPL